MEGKVTVKPGTLLAPIPAVMVSCGDESEKNIITIAWTGIVNSEPPMTYISVRPIRHSYDIIKRTGEFVINLVSEELTYAMDHCGCVSGSKEDKFAEMHLTAIKGEAVSCPLIAEAPINLECRVVEEKALPSHTVFLAEIVAVHCNEDLMDEKGRLAFENAKLVSYIHGEYYGQQKKELGRMGYSVMRPKTIRKKKAEGSFQSGKGPHFSK